MLTISATGLGPLVLNGTGTPLALSNDAKCVVGSNPRFPAFDPVNHYVYVPNSGSSNVSVLTGTCKHVASIALPVGSRPASAVFNPENNFVYVTDNNLNQVYVIGGSVLGTTITSPSFHCPWGEAFDPGYSAVVVTNSCSNTVTIIRETSILLNVAVGSAPVAVGYDPFTATLLVTNFNSNNVTILDALFPGAHKAEVPVGSHPSGIAFDFSLFRDFVTNYGSNNVTLMYGTGALKVSFPVGTAPADVVWSQAKLLDYVSNFHSHNVTVLTGGSLVQTLTLPSTAEPLGEAYDGFNDRVYVADYAHDVVYVF